MTTVYVWLQAQTYTVCDYCRCTSLLCVCARQGLGVYYRCLQQAHLSSVGVYCRLMCLLQVSTAGSCVYYTCPLQAHVSTIGRLTCVL